MAIFYGRLETDRTVQKRGLAVHKPRRSIFVMRVFRGAIGPKRNGFARRGPRPARHADGAGRPPGLRRAAAWPVLVLVSAAVLLPAHAGTAEALRWVDRLQERITLCKDYQYRVTCYERLGGKEERRSFTLYAKDCRLVRIKITSGRGKGSDVAMDGQGRIRGRKGGLLKPFARTLKPEDTRLRSLRGVAFWESAAHSFLPDLRERMAQPGNRCEVEPAKDQPGRVLLGINRPGGVREQYWIDPEQLLLMKAETYESDQLVRRFVIEDVRTNVGLSDSFFSF
jgi:hypothetical protein